MRIDILQFTGHSRGGALANLLAAKRINSGYKVFAYTFASPATTTIANATTATKYKAIFNIVNEDDLVPRLPMDKWGFRRYGVDKTASIDGTLSDEWNELVDGSGKYTANLTALNSVISALEKICNDRDECYSNRNGGYIAGTSTHFSAAAAEVAAKAHISAYPQNMQPYCSWSPSNSANQYGYVIYQQPAFFMQLLAAYMGDELTTAGFLGVNVAQYLEGAKTALSAYSLFKYTNHPHYLESYYLLASSLS